MGQDSAGGAVEGLLDVLPGGPHLVDGVGDGVELQQGDLGLCRLLHELCPAEPVDGTGAHATKVFAVGGCTSSSMGTSGIGPEWVTLPSSRGRFSGQLDATAIDPGARRMHMRVQPENDSGNRLLTVPYLRQETGIAWEAQVEGVVQGALATGGDGVEGMGPGARAPGGGGGGAPLGLGCSFGKVPALGRAGGVGWAAGVGGGARSATTWSRMRRARRSSPRTPPGSSTDSAPTGLHGGAVRPASSACRSGARGGR